MIIIRLLAAAVLLVSGMGQVVAAPRTAPIPPLAYVGPMALDDAGNGWAVARIGAESYTPALLRIQNGAWRVVADSTTNPTLLPSDLAIRRMAITADGREGWAIGIVGDDPMQGVIGWPMIWHLQNGAWHVARNSFSKTLSLDDLTMSADGRTGWIVTREEYPAPSHLLRLHNGHWDYVTVPGGAEVGWIAFSPDGRQGWALRYERASDDYTTLRWRSGRWVPVYQHTTLNVSQVPDELVVDNAGNAWLTTQIAFDETAAPPQLFHFSPSTPPTEINFDPLRPAAATAIELGIGGLTLSGPGNGWATAGWDYAINTGGDNYEEHYVPLLLQLQGGTATPVDPQRVGLPAGARPYQIAGSPHGGHTWVVWADSAAVEHLSPIHAPAR